ncbi:hypothetical protein CFIMG_007407RA00001 [Ceratocystis fimbriata CBS 114723]|uniref:Protein ECM13 n=1 Tax=Ceratocystis fimbriata CBS 114723 TaxID=1035309 RepID=A0A2C5WXY1_9PEZI|nr:hypothetical protein CFIMG_007407RA00001 [Ceratocystis fimbriata CBS 114723]
MISSPSSKPTRSSPLASSSSADSTSPASSISSVSSLSPVSVNRSTMSMTQTYYLAHRARSKLGAEASRSDHNLRVLVGHANLLDTLMLELAEAEREQETWYHNSPAASSKSTSTTSTSPSQARHIQWADQYISQGDSDSDSSSDDWDVSSTEDEEESDDEDFADHIPETSSSLQRMPKNAAAFSPSVVTISAVESDSDSDSEFDDDEDLSQLGLVRTPSHSGAASGSPPELALDCDLDDSSDDEADMPPSPPTAIIDIYRASSKSSGKESLFLTVPPRSPSRLVSNVSVY